MISAAGDYLAGQPVEKVEVFFFEQRLRHLTGHALAYIVVHPTLALMNVKPLFCCALFTLDRYRVVTVPVDIPKLVIIF